MDDQLKQRLWGATIVVALAVIFVPMLFDEKADDRGGVAATDGVPPSSSGGQEREIALPALPAEESQDSEAADDTTGGSRTRERTGYRIIPLDDAPAAGDGRTSSPAAEPSASDPTSEALPAEFGEDEGGAPDQVPTPDSPLAKRPRALGTGSESHPVREAAPAGRGSAASGQESKKVPSVTAAPPPTGHVAPESKAVPAKPPETVTSPKTVKPKVAKPGSEKVTAPSKPKSAAPPRASPGAGRTQAAPSAAKKAPEKSVTVGKSDRDSDGAESIRKQAPSGAAKPASAAAAEPSPPKPMASKAVRVAEAPKSAESSHPVTDSSSSAVDVNKSAEVKPEVAKPKRSSNTVDAASSAGATSSKKKPATIPKAPTAASKSKPSAGSSGWLVRAGSFSSETGAKGLADKLKTQNFAAYVQKVSGDNGVIYRVQIGPPVEKNRAEQTQKRLENSAGIQGVLVQQR